MTVGKLNNRSFRSTRNLSKKASLREVVMKGLAPDAGLYMPVKIPTFPSDFFDILPQLSFHEVSFEVATKLLGKNIPASTMKRIIREAFNFDISLLTLNKNTHLLELFHGPTAAFKDFGARFMARLLSYFLHIDALKGAKVKPLTILVATSGDTGSAVASGFLNVPGIRVTILFPKEKVSKLQEQQLTTYGENSNIWTLEVVDGTFDDCLALVTQAFQDPVLKDALRLTSANSINFGRLLPQTFYYFWAYAELRRKGLNSGDRIVFSVPSGNFGNLTAGVISKKMGLPVAKFIASTDMNRVVPDYLKSGKFLPRPSIETNSPSMNVGNPNNFERLMDLYDGDLKKIRSDIYGTFFTDKEKKSSMKKVWENYRYVMEPHSATAFQGLSSFRQSTNFKGQGVVLMTAHPAKFPDTVEPLIGRKVPMPYGLEEVVGKKKDSTPIGKDYSEFQNFLLRNKDRE